MEVRGDQCGRKHRDGDTGSDNGIERSVGGPSPDRRRRQQCRWNRILLDSNNWRDETIPPARNGLDKAWLCGGIIENLADFFDCSSQTVVEVHKCVRGPELPANFFARDELTRTVQEHGQQLERLGLQPDSCPMLSQLTGMQFRFVGTKSEPARRGNGRKHNRYTAVAVEISKRVGDRQASRFGKRDLTTAFTETSLLKIN